MIKLMIADDHTLVREGMKKILEEMPDVVVAGEATTGQEVIQKILSDDYDIVLLDISMPGRDGIDVLKELKGRKPKLPILIVSMFPEEDYAVRALMAGAAGYLTKESASEELIAAIRKVTTGGKYISAAVAERLAFGLGAQSEGKQHESLSDREMQVMRLVATSRTWSALGWLSSSSKDS